ncbi:hypothetical protein SUGI_0333070 [Cryptomeria japonica]|nr:hypothetical protein SUGI_0333070 [Cryptomeria japonica]
MFNGMVELSMTLDKLPVFYKQRDFKFYPSWAYSLPTWVMRIPLSLMEFVIWIILTYYTIGFAPNPQRFFQQLLLYIAVSQAALGLFRFIAAFGRNQIVPNNFGSFAILDIFVLGEFLISKDDTEGWWIWGYWISPLMYAQNG